MKYIKTKDGIKKIMQERQTCYYVLSRNGISEYAISKEKVIKQADTIEELCDEFVLFDNEYPHDFYIDHYFKDIKEILEEEIERCRERCFYPRKPRQLYGAIWTNKGLTYVAKMNDKGELELL